MKTNIENVGQYISDEDELPLSSVRRRGIGLTPVVLSSDDDSDAAAAKRTTPRPSRPATSAVVTPLRFFIGGRSGAAPLSDSQRRKSTKRSKQRDHAIKAPKPTAPARRFTRSSAGPLVNKKPVETSSDDETELEALPSRKPSSVRPPRSSHSKPAETVETTDDDDDILPRATPARRQKSKAVTVISSGGESSNDGLVISTNRRRIVKKAVEPSPSESQNSANDLQEDLDALRETGV